MGVPVKVIKGAVAVAALAVSAITGIIIDRKIRNKAYKEMLAKHDKETAERMREEFNAELKRIRDAKYDNEAKEQRKINELCRKYGVSPYYA